jgi:hypothetical protein
MCHTGKTNLFLTLTRFDHHQDCDRDHLHVANPVTVTMHFETVTMHLETLTMNFLVPHARRTRQAGAETA